MPQQNDPDVQPVIVVAVDDGGKKKNKKKKRGSSRSSRRLEDIENRASKSLRRVARAVHRGVITYRSRRKDSQSRRRDGAIVDFCENSARGVSKAVSKSSPALVDLAKAFNRGGRRKQIRRLVRGFPVP